MIIRKYCIYKWLIALLLIIWAGATTPAWAYPQTQQSVSWTNVPNQPKQPALWSSTPKLSSGMQPNYQFKSTSAYTPVLGNSAYSSNVYEIESAPITRPRKAGYWNEDGEWVEGNDPIGVVPDPAPVGEPFVLLVMAMLYLLVRYVQGKRMKG